MFALYKDDNCELEIAFINLEDANSTIKVSKKFLLLLLKGFFHLFKDYLLLLGV
jgi:hypothetical protein